MVVLCFHVGLEVGEPRHTHGHTHTHTTQLSGAAGGICPSRRARVGSPEGVCDAGSGDGSRLPVPLPPAALTSGSWPHGNRLPRGLQQEAEPASNTSPYATRVARASLAPGLSSPQPGDFWATHTPHPAPPTARPHVSGSNLGKFFPLLFLSFFFFLS